MVGWRYESAFAKIRYNYMDLDYGKYIPKEYLLDGFDATKDNPYRKKKMNEQEFPHPLKHVEGTDGICYDVLAAKTAKKLF